ALVRLGRALPGACWRSRAFECRAYRQSGTAEIDRRRPKMQPTFFRGARERAPPQPKSSRHERMLWAARKIAHLTGVTEGRAYQMLLGALIEAERESPDEYLDVLGLTR